MTSQQPLLQAFLGSLLADVAISPDNVEIVTDNARLPPSQITKSPASSNKLGRSLCGRDELIMPGDILAALPSRWETTPHHMEAALVQPCLPQRQISIELPFSDDSSSDSSDSIDSTEHSYYGSKQKQQTPPPMPSRWRVDNESQASLKCPERRPISRSMQSENYSSLSSLSTGGIILSPVKLIRNRSD